MASSAIITTAAIATVTSTTTVLVLMSALDGHTTFFSSLFVSRKNFAAFAAKTLHGGLHSGHKARLFLGFVCHDVVRLSYLVSR